MFVTSQMYISKSNPYNLPAYDDDGKVFFFLWEKNGGENAINSRLVLFCSYKPYVFFSSKLHYIFVQMKRFKNADNSELRKILSQFHLFV